MDALVLPGELPLAGYTVTGFFIAYCHDFYLLGDGDSFVLRIESPYTYLTEQGETAIKAAEPEYISPILPLFNVSIISAAVEENGTLHVTFSNQHRIIVHADFAFEAWELNSNTGIKIICLPGGKLAIWDKPPADSSS